MVRAITEMDVTAVVWAITEMGVTAAARGIIAVVGKTAKVGVKTNRLAAMSCSMTNQGALRPGLRCRVIRV